VVWLAVKTGFEAAKKHLESWGIQFGEHPREIKVDVFHDPDGNPLEITYYV